MRTSFAARLSLALLVPLLSSAAVGCGGSSTASGPTVSHKANAERGIEGFGSEASGRDRSAIVATFDAYYRALSTRDYAAACSHLSSNVKRSLEDVAPKRFAGAGCGEILPGFLAAGAPAFAREQVQGRIAKVRVAGDRAFLVYRAPGADLYELTLVRERTRWRADAIAGSVLVPSMARQRG